MTNQGNEKILKEATLVFLRRGTHVLLARKTDKIGEGALNGYGGGVEDGETPESCAVRELYEETHGVVVQADDLRKVGVVYCHNTTSTNVQFICVVHVFVAYEWTGQIGDTREMVESAWYDSTQLPVDDMIPADRDWVPYVFHDTPFVAHVYLGPHQRSVLQPTTVTLVTELP